MRTRNQQATYMPSLEEIREGRKRIQAGWSEMDREMRASCLNLPEREANKHWTPPSVPWMWDDDGNSDMYEGDR